MLEIDPTYQPKVTLVICAKRHHMRFYADHPRDQDKTGNLPAGLVVDRGVTHPFAFDFYCQSSSLAGPRSLLRSYSAGSCRAARHSETHALVSWSASPPRSILII